MYRIFTLGKLSFKVLKYLNESLIQYILHHSYPLQWMGAVRMRANLTNMAPVHQLTPSEAKNWMLVINKLIIN